MSGTDITTTGAAGAAPMPAFVVRPCLPDGVVALLPAAAPTQGTGLPATGSAALAGARFAGVAFGGSPAVRPWEPVLTGATVLEHSTDVFGDAAGHGGYAQRIDSSTPGTQSPGAPLS